MIVPPSPLAGFGSPTWGAVEAGSTLEEMSMLSCHGELQIVHTS